MPYKIKAEKIIDLKNIALDELESQGWELKEDEIKLLKIQLENVDEENNLFEIVIFFSWLNQEDNTYLIIENIKNYLNYENYV
jgi:hypothetical protein